MIQKVGMAQKFAPTSLENPLLYFLAVSLRTVLRITSSRAFCLHLWVLPFENIFSGGCRRVTGAQLCHVSCSDGETSISNQHLAKKVVLLE